MMQSSAYKPKMLQKLWGQHSDVCVILFKRQSSFHVEILVTLGWFQSNMATFSQLAAVLLHKAELLCQFSCWGHLHLSSVLFQADVTPPPVQRDLLLLKLHHPTLHCYLAPNLNINHHQLWLYAIAGQTGFNVLPWLGAICTFTVEAVLVWACLVQILKIICACNV